MPSRLGQVIASVRATRGIGLRALARMVDRSPTFLVMIEKAETAPGIAEETLRRIAAVLELDPDHLITLAGKTPQDVVPSDELEVAIYRLVKGLSPSQKRQMLQQLKRRAGRPPSP